VASVLNNNDLFRSDRALDLSRLNEAERRVLRLLAEGHTAKTIATALGSTPAAVNERLRESRRKTGAGSSRELARMLKAQENRDEQIGVGKLRPGAALLPQSAAELWRPQTGVLAMFASLIVAVGAAALWTQIPAPQQSAIVDPLIGTIPSSDNGPDRLYARLRAEQRDPSWAPRAEQVLRTRLSQVPYVGSPRNMLRVTCGSSICEAAGIIGAPTSKNDQDSLKTPLSRTMQALQGKAIHDDLTKSGLNYVSASFGGSPAKPPRTTFLIYFERAK
jgi:DNA-binding CsgD family transcriptional regulator